MSLGMAGGAGGTGDGAWGLGATGLWVVGVIAAMWLALAAAALLKGLRLSRAAAADAEEAERLRALVAATPAPVLVVASDWRVAGDARASALLGLSRAPQVFDELDARHAAEPGGGRGGADAAAGGLDAATHQALYTAIQDVRQGARPLMLPLRPVGSARTILARGAVADRALVPDALLDAAGPAVALWLFDATESEAERQAAADARDAAMAAYEAMAGVVAGAPIPIWLRDEAGALVMANDAYVAAIGDGDEAAVLAAGASLVEPDPTKDAGAPGPGAPLRVTATVAGERRRLDVAARPVTGGGRAGYAIDAEAAERAAQALTRQAAAQRDLLDRLSAAVAQFGPDGALAFGNMPCRRLFRLDAWRGEAPPDFARFLDHAREQGRAPEVRDFPAWRAERTGWLRATEAVEDEWHLRDGTHLRIVAQPTPDGGLLLIAEDRTEQVQLATTRDTLLRVRTATFDNLFEAVAVFAPDGRLHLWNQRFRKLWSAEEALLADHPRIDQLMDALADRLERPRDASAVTQIVRGATTERQHRGGAMGFADGRQFDFAAIPLPDGNALFLMLDVTDSREKEASLKERNAALEAADRVKTAFLSRMSYELRTPLTAIGGYAELLGEGYAGSLPEPAVPYVAAIREAAGVLGRHIDNLLDLSQGEAGTLALDLAPVGVAGLVRAAAARAQGSAEAAGLTLKVAVGRGAGEVVADARRLDQLLDQLIGNAVRYTGQHRRGDGQVSVTAEAAATGAVAIRIRDNGPGLPPALVGLGADVENGGQQGKAEPARGGIGLALARALVAAHGGTFEIGAGSPKAGGTEVVITLPRSGPDGAPL